MGDTFSADMRLTFDTQVCRRNPPLLRTLQNDGRDAQRGQGDREGILERDGNIGLARRAGAVPHAARDLVNLGLIEPDRVSHLEPCADRSGLAFVDELVLAGKVERDADFVVAWGTPLPTPSGFFVCIG